MAGAAAPQFKAMACPHCEALVALHPDHMDRTHKCPKCSKTFLGKEALKPSERRSNKKFEDLQLSGRQLGNYLLQEMLGHGACGAVYRGQDVMLKRTVAIKILPPSISSHDEISLQRFLQEAQLAAQLVHPNVIQTYYISQEDGIYYICMEYVDGGNLSDRIGKGRKVSPRRAMKFMSASAEALRVAHSRGIIHRDIKPTNLMITSDGMIKVADFGLAKLQDAQVQLTQERRVVGTPQYMSPEQCKGEKATNKSDIYALGVTFYHAITGVPPFVAESLMGVAYKHIHDPVPDPREKVPDLPERFAEVIMKCMAKSPGDRYSDAQALRLAIDDALHDGDDELSQSNETWGTLSSSRVPDMPSGGFASVTSSISGSHQRMNLSASMTNDGRKMYHSQFGLDKFPFRSPDRTEGFYTGGNFARSVDAVFGHVNLQTPVIVLTGPTSIGKSYLTKIVLSRLGDAVASYRLRAGFLWENSFVCTLAQEMNLIDDDSCTAEKALRELQRRAMKHDDNAPTNLIILDEVDQLDDARAEDLASLVGFVRNAEAWSLLIIGRDGLDHRLMQQGVLEESKPPAIIQLEPLSLTQMQEYIAHRLSNAGVAPGTLHFTRSALESLHHFTQGCPGRVNLIAHNALVLASALNEPRVTATMVLRARQKDGFAFSPEELPLLADEQLGIFCRPDVIDVLARYPLAGAGVDG